MILVLDIDGTLADASHRAPAVGNWRMTLTEWDKFFDHDLVTQDPPLPLTQDVLPRLVEQFDKVIFLTGRPQHLRETTAAWLQEHYGIRPSEDELFMRPNDSNMHSRTLKRSILKNQVLPIYGDAEMVFVDDEDKNLDMFKTYGETFKAPECWEEFRQKLGPARRATQAVVELPIERVNPLHEVRDEEKLASLTQKMQEHGWEGRPLLVEPFEDGYQAWTGSHRLAAAKQIGLDTVPAVVIDYDKAVAVVKRWGYTPDELRHGIGDSIIEDEERYQLLCEAKDEPAARLMFQEVLSNSLQEISNWTQELKETIGKSPTVV